LGEQNETGLKRELSQNVRPPVLRWFGGLGDNPELAVRMMNDRDALAGGRADGPTAPQKVNLLISVDAPLPLQRQVQIQQAGVWTETSGDAPLDLGFGAGVVRRQARGAADSAVLPEQFLSEQFLGGLVGGDLLVGQQREQPVLEGAEAALDFALGLGTGGDEVGDTQGGEGALKLGAGIATVGGGLMTEQGQPIGVEGQRQAMAGESATKVLEVVPGGIGGNKSAAEEFAGMIIDGEQEGLLVGSRPPLVDRGVVLPEFADAGALPERRRGLRLGVAALTRSGKWRRA
jgi:hypothetical protein